MKILSDQIEAKRKYRASFILDTRGLETPVESQIEILSKTVAELGGEVEKAENLGRKDFVRLTDANHPGDHYIQLEIEALPEAPAQLREKLRLNRSVKRVYVESMK